MSVENAVRKALDTRNIDTSRRDVPFYILTGGRLAYGTVTPGTANGKVETRPAFHPNMDSLFRDVIKRNGVIVYVGEEAAARLSQNGEFDGKTFQPRGSGYTIPTCCLDIERLSPQYVGQASPNAPQSSAQPDQNTYQ